MKSEIPIMHGSSLKTASPGEPDIRLTEMPDGKNAYNIRTAARNILKAGRQQDMMILECSFLCRKEYTWIIEAAQGRLQL